MSWPSWRPRSTPRWPTWPRWPRRSRRAYAAPCATSSGSCARPSTRQARGPRPRPAVAQLAPTAAAPPADGRRRRRGRVGPAPDRAASARRPTWPLEVRRAGPAPAGPAPEDLRVAATVLDSVRDQLRHILRGCGPRRVGPGLTGNSQGNVSHDQAHGAGWMRMGVRSGAVQSGGTLSSDARDGAQARPRLLVVEDDPNIVELLSASLRFAGFEVDRGHQRRRRGRRSAREIAARPGRARRDAARPRRLRGDPAACARAASVRRWCS